jgi:hypothetical protein
VTIEYIDGEGDLPVFPSQTAILLNDTNRIYVMPFADIISGQTFRFRSMRVHLVVPESYSNTLSGVTTQFELQLNLTSSGETPPDPGEWIRFVDAPTPVLVNQLRQKKIQNKIKKLKTKIRRLARGKDAAKIVRLKKKIRALRAVLRRA